LTVMLRRGGNREAGGMPQGRLCSTTTTLRWTVTVITVIVMAMLWTMTRVFAAMLVMKIRMLLVASPVAPPVADEEEEEGEEEGVEEVEAQK
jgi:hypothetical protein